MKKPGAKKCAGDCRECPAFSRSAFQALSEAGLKKIQAAKKMSAYSREETFSCQGEPVANVYCLKSGSAKVTWRGQKNKESIVRLAAAGDLLGYRCIFSEKTYRATASALENAEACTINKDIILSLVDSEPNFALELLRRMGQEISRAEKHHHAFVQKDARERLAEAIVRLHDFFGKAENGQWLIRMPLTRNELANWVGVAKETCIRILADFRQAGWVELSEGEITVIAPIEILKLSGNYNPNSSPNTSTDSSSVEIFL